MFQTNFFMGNCSSLDYWAVCLSGFRYSINDIFKTLLLLIASFPHFHCINFGVLCHLKLCILSIAVFQLILILCMQLIQFIRNFNASF